MITTILFDLDGTLLPMDEEVFVKTYFGKLVQKLLPLGYDGEQLVPSIWAGTKAMMKNDGTDTNENVFWKVFSEIHGEKCLEDMPVFEEFYRNEFNSVQSVCGFDPDAKKAVEELKKMGFRVALATNPLFPSVATESRLKWAGFSPENFEYISTYENFHYCKPSTEYYKEFIAALGVSAEECMMVGNSVDEDMIAAQKLGMQTFLCPACLVNKNEVDISGYPQGNFSDLVTYVKTNFDK